MTIPTLQFRVKLNTSTAKVPTRATDGSVGWDLYADERMEIYPNERTIIDTGVVIDQLPYGTYGRVAPRSGLAVRDGIDVLAGVVDPDYRGVIGVVLINHGDDKVIIKKGDRIAQLILEQYYNPSTCDVVSVASNTERGSGGFGSTGV